MPTNPDFKDLFNIFDEERVEYLVVGAHAVIFFTEPRYTKDLDIWVNPTPENAVRVFRALERFGAPLSGVTPADFCNPDLVYQIGVAPNRIDIIMGIAGVNFSEAWAGRVESTYGGVRIYLLGKDALLRTKRATGRLQDLLDVERLQAQSGFCAEEAVYRSKLEKDPDAGKSKLAGASSRKNKKAVGKRGYSRRAGQKEH